MKNRNSQKLLKYHILAIITLLLWPYISHANDASCFYNDQSHFLVTKGDFHLHGKPKQMQIWTEGKVKTPAFSATFDPNSKILQQKSYSSICNFTYSGNHLSEVKINSKSSSKLDGTTISASHFNALGEPDIFVTKGLQDSGPYATSTIISMTTIKHQEEKVSYSTYIPLDDKPTLISKTIASYQSDGFLKSVDFYYIDMASQNFKINYSVNYLIRNASIAQKDLVSGTTGLITETLNFEETELDACKNWTKRIVNVNMIESKVSEKFVETREINYHTPCE